MEFNEEQLYEILAARDRRFDGRVYVAVSSTKIYCRPICPARTPKPSNCTFYKSSAAAQKAGFRPCLRCRPELAPGNAPSDREERWLQRALLLFQQGHLRPHESLGVGERQLRGIFLKHLGVPPNQYLQNQRLALAKQLLTDTALSVTDVAMTSGYQSLSRFNSAWKRSMGFAPSRLRQGLMQEQHKADVSSNIVLQLRYRPPFDWHSWLEFVATRAIPGCELVIGDSYIRTLSVGGEVGWLKLSALDDRVEVSISASLQGQVGKLLPKLRHFLDLDACPETISKHLGSMYLPGLRVPGCLDGFEIGVRAILGQQVSVAAARTMAARITEAKGQALETPWPNLGRLFPTPETLSDYDFPGLPKKRAQTIRDLSNLVQKGLDLSPAGDWDETRQALLNTTGIGPWTAGYITMRCMQNPDAFPTGDLVLCQRLGMKPKELEAHSQIWRPWRAYAAISIWKASPCTKAST